MSESKSYLYQYSFLGNRDKLKSYNGEHIEYDALGNPIIYRDKNLVWDKGCLKQYKNIMHVFSKKKFCG